MFAYTLDGSDTLQNGSDLTGSNYSNQNQSDQNHFVLAEYLHKTHLTQ